MTCTFSTRLRAALVAGGLFAATAVPARGGDDLIPVPPGPTPANYPPNAGNAPAPLLPPTTGVPGADQFGLQAPAPSGTMAPLPHDHGNPPPATPLLDGHPIGGEQIMSGGMGYLASTGCCGSGCTSSMYYIKADYVHLRRDIDNPRTVVATQLTNGDVFTTRLEHWDFDWDPSMRITAGMALIETSACDLFLETTYFGLHHSRLEGDVVAPVGGVLFGSRLSRLFDSVQEDAFAYVSDLHSVELNLKWDYYVDNSLYVLLGLRYIRFDDRFVDAEAGVINNNPPPFIPEALERVRVTNNLIGLQIGFDWQSRPCTSPWGFDVYGRAGVFANILDGHIEQAANASLQTGFGPNGAFLNEIRPGRLQLSGALEGGVTGTWRAAPNLYIRGGYHVLWLGAIALAPDQPRPDLTDLKFEGKLSNNQDVLFHGPFVGLEYHWGCCR